MRFVYIALSVLAMLRIDSFAEAARACVAVPRDIMPREAFESRAKSLGLDTCVEYDVVDDAARAHRYTSSRTRSSEGNVDCTREILSFLCGASPDASGFACETQSGDATPESFDTCVAPLCAEMCDDDDGARSDTAHSTLCDRCAEARSAAQRARFGSGSFGSTWSTSPLNPANVNAVLTSTNFANALQSYLRAQATIWLMRTIYQSIMNAVRGTGGYSAGASPTPVITFPTYPSTPTPTPTPTPSPPSVPSSQCGLVVNSCASSCGLCVYPDATSNDHLCCCDATCVDYGDCCSDIGECCSSKSQKANVRARPRADGRSRARHA